MFNSNVASGSIPNSSSAAYDQQPYANSNPGGRWQQQSQLPQQSTFFPGQQLNGGYTMPPPSTSNIFQQQLAAQQAQQSALNGNGAGLGAGQGQRQPPSSFQPPPPSQQTLSQLQHAQSQQQQQSSASQSSHHLPSASPQSSFPNFPQLAAPNPQIQAVLANMTQEKFQSLQPQQQAALKAYMLQQKMAHAQQGGGGMGYASSSSPSPATNGINNNSASPAGNPGQAGGGYLQGGSTPGGGANYGTRPPPSQVPPGQSMNQSSPSPMNPNLPPPQPSQQQQEGPGGQNPSFFKALSEFWQRRGTSVPNNPMVEGKLINLAQLYSSVVNGGGFAKVHNSGSWRNILSSLGFPPDGSQTGHPEARVMSISQLYHSILLPFETFFRDQQQSRLQQQQQQQQNLSNPNSNQQHNPQSQPQLSQHQQPQSQPPRQSGTPFQPPPPPPPPTTPALPPPPPIDAKKGKGKAKEIKKLPASKKSKQSTVKEEVSTPAVDTPPPASSTYPSTSASSFSTITPSLPLPFSSSSAPSLPPSASGSQPPAFVPLPPHLGGGGGGGGGLTDAFGGSDRTRQQQGGRKRQKFEYVPLSRTVESHGVWDLGQVEDLVANVGLRKKVRSYGDLGMVDVHSLTMSLRSRLGSEVAFALNSLTLISLSMRASNADPNGVFFPLSACGGLLDELVDLLYETTHGILDETDPIEDQSTSPPSVSLAYRELFRLAVQEESELRTSTVTSAERAGILSDDGLCPLNPVEVTLALTNLLRNLSIADDNAKMMVSKPRVLEVLVKVGSLPLKKGGSSRAGGSRYPLQVSAADSLALRKDVLETITNFGLDVRLRSHSIETATSLFQLLTFFLADADHSDQPYLDLSTSPSASSRLTQTQPLMSHYLDLGLAAFARLTLPDENRYILATVSGVDLYSLFESLVHLLPITETDFQLVTSEPGLIFAENLAMSLYNLVFLAPAELKIRLRVMPGFIKAFVRVVKRLIGTTLDPHENPFITLCNHCIATLQILSDVGGVSGSQEAADGLWWGLGPNSDQVADEGRRAVAQPSDADRGTVKARQPPRSAGSSRPAVLAGETRSVFEMLLNGSSVAAFTKLYCLIDSSKM